MKIKVHRRLHASLDKDFRIDRILYHSRKVHVQISYGPLLEEDELQKIVSSAAEYFLYFLFERNYESRKDSETG